VDPLQISEWLNNKGIEMKRTIALHQPPAGERHPLATPADWLGHVGKAKWRETVADVPELQNADGDCLAAYCEAWQEFHHAREELVSLPSHYCVGPNGGHYPHPAIGQKNKALERIRKFARELQLTKCTRKPPKPKAAPQVTRTKPAS
jgi:P27 family predicted phage terminase small subunit